MEVMGLCVNSILFLCKLSGWSHLGLALAVAQSDMSVGHALTCMELVYETIKIKSMEPFRRLLSSSYWASSLSDVPAVAAGWT